MPCGLPDGEISKVYHVTNAHLSESTGSKVTCDLPESDRSHVSCDLPDSGKSKVSHVTCLE